MEILQKEEVEIKTKNTGSLFLQNQETKILLGVHVDAHEICQVLWLSFTTYTNIPSPDP